MASVTRDLRLPSQPQNITAPWPVPNYTMVTEAHGCEVWTTCLELLPSNTLLDDNIFTSRWQWYRGMFSYSYSWKLWTV